MHQSSVSHTLKELMEVDLVIKKAMATFSATSASSRITSKNDGKNPEMSR